MTKKQAIALYDSGEWMNWTAYERVKRQLFEERLIMPFKEFKQAADIVFGRPMSSVDLAEAALKKEFRALPVPTNS